VEGEKRGQARLETPKVSCIGFIGVRISSLVRIHCIGVNVRVGRCINQDPILTIRT
jgi:hypothetical protein